MTSDKLNELHTARPFMPFIIHMNDGRQFKVEHPELLAHRRGTRIAYLQTSGDAGQFIDVLMIASIEIGTATQRRRRAS